MICSDHLDLDYEGVISESWYEKSDDDPNWSKVNQLKSELILFLKNCDNKNGKQQIDKSKMIQWIVNILDAFNDQRKPIAIVNRRTWTNFSVDNQLGIVLKDEIEDFTFPETERRARMVVLLCRVYLLLRQNKFASKKDLYYRDKSTYGTQSICDDLIADLCCVTYNSRRQLHILSSAKGLIYGRLEFTSENNRIRCMDFKSGVSIRDSNEMKDLKSDAKFILVVEKDASFQYLIDEKIIDKFPIILITGKGYPDLDTRCCVKSLSCQLQLPVFVLVDCNPHGLAIFLTYRFGSRSMAHEAHNCTVTQAKWFGLLPTELEKFNIPDEQMMPLSKDDLKMIKSFKHRPYITSDKLIMEQVEFMLKKNRKAEIQSIENVIGTYLPHKIKNGYWI